MSTNNNTPAVAILKFQLANLTEKVRIQEAAVEKMAVNIAGQNEQEDEVITVMRQTLTSEETILEETRVSKAAKEKEYQEAMEK